MFDSTIHHHTLAIAHGNDDTSIFGSERAVDGGSVMRQLMNISPRPTGMARRSNHHVEHIPGEADDLAPWLDKHLASLGWAETCAPGSSRVYILVEAGRGTHHAQLVQDALDHARFLRKDCVTVYYYQPGRGWSR
jgi:hypothetical protein